MDIYGFRKEFQKGSYILHEGDSGDTMYIVRSGKVRVFKGHDDRETTLAILGPGEFFGEMALIGAYPRSASASAEEDATCTVIDRQTFNALISDPIVFDIMRRMAERIRQLDEALYDASSQDQLRRAYLSRVAEHKHWFV